MLDKFYKFKAAAKIKIATFLQLYSGLLSILLILAFSSWLIIKLYQVKQQRNTQAQPLLFSAKNYLSYHQIDSAKIYVNQALKIGGRIDSVHLLLGQIALSSGAPGQAITNFQTALRHNHRLTPAYAGQGDALLSQAQNEAAIRSYQVALKQDTSLISAQLGLANAYFNKGSQDTARITSIADLYYSSNLYRKIMTRPGFSEQVNLADYIRLLDNLSGFQDSPMETAIFQLLYVQKAALAKDIYRRAGDRPGIRELAEAFYNLIENKPDSADAWFTRSRQKDSTNSAMIEGIKSQYNTLVNWKGNSRGNYNYSSFFRFNRNRTGVINGTGIVTPKIKWRIRLGRVGMISPILYRGNIIQVAPELKSVVLINPSNGQIIYQLPKEYFSNSTPAIAENHLWIDAPRYDFFVIPMNQFTELTAFEKSNISSNYTQIINDSSPLEIGGSILFCTSLGQFRRAFLRNNRIRNWIWLGGQGQITAPPVVGDSLAMFGGHDLRFYAIAYQNARESQNFQLRTSWIYWTDAVVTASACVNKGVVYFGDLNGKIHAVPESINRGQANQIALATFKVDSGFVSSPAIDDSLVFFCSKNGKIYALPTFDRRKNFTGTDDPRLPWTPKYVYQAEGSIISSPCITGGVLYIGTDAGEILALEARDINHVLWRLILGGSVKSSPLVINNTLYVGTEDGYFYAIGD